MIVQTGWLGDLRCACGSADIACIAAGEDEDRVGGDGLDLLIRRGTEMRATCMACAVARGWLQQEGEHASRGMAGATGQPAPL